MITDNAITAIARDTPRDTRRSAPTAPTARQAIGSSIELDDLLQAREALRRGIRPDDGPIRLVLLDDQHLMRQALKALLGQDDRMQLMGDTGDLKECLSLVEQRAAQLVILNADMHDGQGLDAVRAITHTPTPPRVLALGDDEEPGRVLAMYRAGASGFLTKQAALQELRDAVSLIAAGSIYVGVSTAKAIASGLRDAATNNGRHGARSMIEQLSDRERTVLRLIARGFSGPEVAEQLHITTKTVDTYRHRIHEKIGLRHRSEYVQAAIDAGILLDG